MFNLHNFLLLEGGIYRAKGDQEKTMSDVQQQRNLATQNYGGAAGQAQNRLYGSTPPGGALPSGAAGFGPHPEGGGGLIGQQQQQLSDVTSNLKNFAGTGGLGDTSQISSGYGNIANTGGMDISSPIATYRGLQSGSSPVTGGLINNFGSPTGSAYTGVNKSIQGLQGIGATGGLTQEDINNINRPLFQEFEQTGGYSPQEQSDIKAESNAVIPSFYQSLQDQMDRQRAQSGYSPSFGDQSSALARQSAIDSGNQALNTRIGLANAIRQGRMGAAQQLASGSMGLAQLRTGNQLQGLSSAASAGLGETGQAQNALKSAGDLQLAAAAGDVNAQAQLRAGQLAGLGGLTNLAGMGQQGRMFGTSGLAGLYNSTTGQIGQEEQNYLNSIGGQAGSANQNLGIQAGVAQQPGSVAQGFGNVFRGIGAVAGAIPGLGGGFWNSGGFTPQQDEMNSQGYYS